MNLEKTLRRLGPGALMSEIRRAARDLGSELPRMNASQLATFRSRAVELLRPDVASPRTMAIEVLCEVAAAFQGATAPAPGCHSCGAPLGDRYWSAVPGAGDLCPPCWEARRGHPGAPGDGRGGWADTIPSMSAADLALLMEGVSVRMFGPAEDDVSPGVRHLVDLLNAAGYETTDSGDGSNHAAGMGCALPYRHVFGVVRPSEEGPSYTPADQIADHLSRVVRAAGYRDAIVEVGYSTGDKVLTFGVFPDGRDDQAAEAARDVELGEVLSGYAENEWAWQCMSVTLFDIWALADAGKPMLALALSGDLDAIDMARKRLGIPSVLE